MTVVMLAVSNLATSVAQKCLHGGDVETATDLIRPSDRETFAVSMPRLLNSSFSALHSDSAPLRTAEFTAGGRIRTKSLVGSSSPSLHNNGSTKKPRTGC
jgi:hypothetical protein